MSARLVNLQRHLRAAQDDVHLALRALRGGQQRDRFLADALRVLAEPRTFAVDLASQGFSDEEIRVIMSDNGRALTLPAA